MNTVNNKSEIDEPLDLHLLIAKLWLKRVWILVSVAVFSAAFVAVALLMTPVYRATVGVVSASADRNGLGSTGAALGSLGSVASLAGINLGSGDSGKEEALAVLLSRQFTEGFISENKLLPKLTAAEKGIKSPDRLLTPWKAFKYFDRIRTVLQDKKTGIISIEVDWIDREEAAAWANGLVERVNEEMRDRATVNANASVGYLEKALATTPTVETREAISRLIESQIKQRMLAAVTKDYAFRVVDPAMAPDADDPLRPRKLVLIVLGPIMGLLFGAVLVIGHGMFSPQGGGRRV